VLSGVQIASLLSSVTCLVLPYIFFPHYLLNDKSFGQNVTGYKMCVLIFTPNFFSVIFLILRRFKRDMNKYMYWFSCVVLFIPVRY